MNLSQHCHYTQKKLFFRYLCGQRNIYIHKDRQTNILITIHVLRSPTTNRVITNFVRQQRPLLTRNSLSSHIRSSKRKSSPVLVTERWAGADPRQSAGDFKPSIIPAVGCHYFPPGLRYLPSQRASPNIDRYQIILFGDRGTCV